MEILNDIPAPFIWLIVICWVWGIFSYFDEGHSGFKYFGLLLIFPFVIIGIVLLRGIF